ncbi:MAG: general secretion pathway protein A [Arenicella sp.]
MYLEYFGLTERPFSIAPDPHYLYMSERHKEAMAHLTYGLSQGGCFIVLTGEVGTGKTTLCRNLLGDLPDDVEVALILNANINEQELLQTVCDELKIAYQTSDSQKQLLDKLNSHLLAGFAENRQTVLIIDEAQLLGRDVLEQIRLLTNLETTKSKLLQIILIGQPELNDLLSRNDLRQLAQRVTARYHLGALQRSEIESYVNFRLSVAGCRKPLFTRQALSQLHRLTDGIPRRINVLADHALLAAYSKTDAVVDAKSVKTASKEVFIHSSKSTKVIPASVKWGFAILSLVLINVALWWWFTAEPYQSKPAPIVNVSPSAVDQSESELDSAIAKVENIAAINQFGQVVDKLAPGEAAPNGVTTIIRSDDIAPGTVVIADQPLDESELFIQQATLITTQPQALITTQPQALITTQPQALITTQPSAPITQRPALIIQPPKRVFSYDSGSELGQALDASADLTGRIAAFRALSAAWDVDLPSQLIQPACDVLKDSGVACLSITSWSQLQRYNRPAILVLDQNDSLHRVIVFKIERGSAQVLVGQSVLDVSINELQSRWTNNGITFWRPTVDGRGVLQQGDTSNNLPAIRVAINQALSERNMSGLDDLTSTDFDLSLAQAVFATQTAYSLLADSKVGSETYLLLNEILLPEQTPVLRQRVR